MKRIDIINTIRQLARSQGYYCRLYDQLMYIAKNDPIAFNEYMAELEGKNFKGALDVVLYFEGE